jgi:hypothetical protein
MRYEDNIKMDLTQIYCENGRWCNGSGSCIMVQELGKPSFVPRTLFLLPIGLVAVNN